MEQRIEVRGEDLQFALGKAPMEIFGEMDIYGLEDIYGAMDNYGAEIVFGSEDDEPELVIGRQRSALRRLLRRVDKKVAVVMKRKLRNLRRQILQFDAITVDTNGTAQFSTSPQQLFKPKRLSINATGDFDVTDIKIANKSQLVSATGRVPGTLFNASTWNTNVDFLTANVGNDVVVDVVDTSGASNRISMAMFGLVAEA